MLSAGHDHHVATVGKSSVEITAELAGFARELETALNAEIRKVRLNAEPVAQQLSDAFRQAAFDAAASLSRLGTSADGSMQQVADAIEDAASSGVDAMQQMGRESQDSFRQMAQAAVDASDSIQDAISATDESIQDLESEIKSLERQLQKTGDQDVFDRLRDTRAELASLRRLRNILDDIGDEADRAARKTEDLGDKARGVSGVGSAALSGLQKVVVGLGASLVATGASVPTPQGLIAFAASASALASAIPVVVGVGSALLDLIGLIPTLPAAAGVAAAAFGTLKIAMLGVSDAFSAILEGDPKKITEALEKLSPAARSVAREFQALVPALKSVQQETQDAFFTPLKGQLTELVDAMLPRFRTGMTGIAATLGQVGREFLSFLANNKELGDFIDRAFSTADEVIRAISPALQDLVDIFVDLGSVGLDVLPGFAKWLADGADKLADWVDEARSSGQLKDWLGQAADTLKDLWELLQAVFNLVLSLFSKGDDEGRSFIQTLTDMVNKLAEFFRSAEGQEALQNLVDGIPRAVSALEKFVVAIIAVGHAINGIVNAYNAVTGFFSAIGSGIADAASAVGGFFVDAWNSAYAAVTGFFTGVGAWFGQVGAWISGAASSIASGLSGAWNSAYAAVTGFFTSVGTWFSELPGKIAAGIAAAGTALLSGLKAAFDGALQLLGMLIGVVLYTVLQLPQQIWAGLQALPGLIASVFTSAWTWVQNASVAAFDAVVGFVTALPGRIWSALQALPGLISSAFTTAWNAARNATTSAFNAVVAWGAALPGRIGSALSRLGGVISGIFRSAMNAGRSAVTSGFNSIVSLVSGAAGRIGGLAGRFLSAGKSLISAMFRGLRNVGGWAGSLASSISGAIRSGINAAIRSINAGIARVDSALPGSLPRIPYLARGGMTIGPTLAALSETGQREVVLPIEDQRTMAALREAMGSYGPAINLLPGAVVVQIQGRLTEGEARRVGAAAGQGLLDTIAAREARLAVRTA